MVIQPGERNAFDQRSIEYELLKKYGHTEVALWVSLGRY